MAKIPKNELNKRTEDEWIDAIRTEYEAAKAEAKFPGDKQAILACLRLAASVREAIFGLLYPVLRSL